MGKLTSMTFPSINYMLDLDECRSLSPNLKDLSDEEVNHVRKTLYKLANLSLKSYIDMNNVSKHPTGVLPKNQNSVSMNV